ncbi:hypothetical protein FA10DRAFT_88504 [Acaromyces ingoldii]|uniref:RlpA-like protein double-psi beta-barrel domain-containing protein n=1 Tax=Acaromyces ingoldii TaxID=215250 RepID=A0A316YTA9_9BASI|nr:hypothetical protein FA10DRAFT_88504 [Acaromyces ingoldii]PWN92276.1 hypothetical protein FA10DRAFT_88504 [Acaromyces ingoldii]
MRFSTVALAITAVLATSIVATEATNETIEVVSRDETHALGVRHKKPHHTKKGWEVYTDCKLTWYGGGQLDAPACGGATPSDSSMIVAVSTDSPFKCHDKLHLHHQGKMVEVTVVDHCDGCAPHHVDATKGVFSKLANLDDGVISGLHIRRM